MLEQSSQRQQENDMITPSSRRRPQVFHQSAPEGTSIVDSDKQSDGDMYGEERVGEPREVIPRDTDPMFRSIRPGETQEGSSLQQQ